MIYIRYRNLIRFTCLLLLGTLLNGCKYDDLSVSKPNENFRLAGDFLKNNYDFSLFYAALDYTGLAGKLNEAGPFTVIAPNNQAFNELGILQPEDFRKLNRDSLRQAMAYHIMPRKLLMANMPVNSVDTRYETLAGISLYASFATFSPGNTTGANLLFFSGSEVYRKDVSLANGTMHAVSKVMKQYPGKTVQDWLSVRPNYSIYVSGLKKFGLWEELAGKGPFTIFAPDNKAFTDAGISQDAVNQLNPAEYNGARLFGAYILYGKNYFITDNFVYTYINSENGYRSTVRNDDSAFWWSLDGITLSSVKGPQDWFYKAYLNAADFSRTDHLCENGLVHRLPGVLVMPKNAKKN